MAYEPPAEAHTCDGEGRWHCSACEYESKHDKVEFSCEMILRMIRVMHCARARLVELGGDIILNDVDGRILTDAKQAAALIEIDAVLRDVIGVAYDV